MSQMLELFAAARRVSVPILVIRTADQAATATAIEEALPDHAVLQWDAVRGITAMNAKGVEVMAKPQDNNKKVLQPIKSDETVAFADAMVAAMRMTRATVLLAHNAHRQLASVDPLQTAANVQAVANLRDELKTNYRMLVLLGPHFTVPSELEQDVVVIEHELPGPEELRAIVEQLHVSARKGQAAFPEPAPETIDKAVEAVSGLSAFAAEQVTAMSLRADGLDLNALWERKRVTIEQTAGLSVYRGGDRFDDLQGLDSAKAKFRRRLRAKTPVGVVVWIDEGSDVFANLDTGTADNQKMDQQRALLVEMEQNNWKGAIFTGVPGGGKSALARAFGNEAGAPCIQVDFGAMENKYVGESEQNLRQAIRVIKAVGRGHAFFVLTCNSLAGIRPQFMRRFKKGVFFFDVPTAEEREAIWRFYLRKHALDVTQPRPDDDAWTGAEIRECCEEAWDADLTLVEAAQHIIPVARSRARDIDLMRMEAHGRFLDANRPGAYQYRPEAMERQVRAITLPPAAVAALEGMKES